MTNIRLLTLISALCFVATGITSPLIGLYLQSLGADFQQISWILSSVVVVSFFSNYLWGRLSDRLQRRKPLLIVGLSILALAFFSLSYAGDQRWAWASRIFEGIGSAAYVTLSLALMGDLLDKEKNKGRQMGWYRGLASAAFAIGAILGGWLADQTSIAQTLQLCSGLYVVAALCALGLQEQPRSLATPFEAQTVTLQDRSLRVPSGRARSAETSASVRLSAHAEVSAESLTSKPRPAYWLQGLPLLFLAGVILWTGAHTASASMWPNYMDSLGYSKTVIGRLWGFAAFIEFPAMRLTGGLSDTLGRAPLLTAGGLGIMLVNLGYLFLAQYLPLLLGVQVIRGFGFGSYTTNAMTYATESGAANQRGSRSGIFNSAASLGSLLGTMLGGTLVQHFGFSVLYGVCASLALGSALSFWLLRRQTTTAGAPEKAIA